MTIKKYKLLLLSCFSGVLLWFGFPTLGFAPLMLFALLPLLVVEDYISNDKTKRFSGFAGFLYSFPCFLIYNALSAYWIYFSTPLIIPGFFLNASWMALAFQFFHFAKKHILIKSSFINNTFAHLVLFLSFFLCFEYLHLDWDLSFPWLMFGNSFSTMPYLIQWYEYTGVLGGSSWVIICNFALFSLIKTLKKKESKKIIFASTRLLGVIIIPIIISLIIWNNYEQEETQPIDIVVVQPNIDPYQEQYSVSPKEIARNIITMAKTKTDTNTSFILMPESCLQDRAWEKQLPNTYSVRHLQDFANQYGCDLITGGSMRRLIEGEHSSTAARPIIGTENLYYENHNIAINIKPSFAPLETYSKSKLTPFVENMPFKRLIKQMEKYAIDFGGATGSLGIDTVRKVFEKNNIKVAPLICYESIYGGFVTEFVRNGANMLFIITNDGWWQDTQGHKQHCSFASLRAIETRRPIARSANTGISCFVTPRGEIYNKTEYWEEDVIKASLKPQTSITFYAKHSDYLGRIFSFAAFLLIIIAFVNKIVKKKELITPI